jgi:hypothetical protein
LTMEPTEEEKALAEFEAQRRAEFKEKLKSLSFMGSERRAKTTVDVHDYGKVKTTEHWNDRVDVDVKPDTIRLKGPKVN